MERGRRAVGWALAGVAYYLAARSGILLAVFPEGASPIWPATGIAIGFLTLAGPRAWPVIAIASYLAELPLFGPALAVVPAGGATLEGLAGAWLLRGLGGVDAFLRPGDLARFFGIAVLACIPSAVLGTLAVFVQDGPTSWWAILGTWYMGDVMGALLVTPAVVLAMGPPAPERRLLEVVPLGLLSAAVTVVAFYPWRSGQLAEVRLGFLVILPLIWVALRLGPRLTAWVSLVLAGGALEGLRAGALPLGGSQNAVLLQLQALTGLMVSLGLLLAAAVHANQQAFLQLGAANERLERADSIKTAFLNKAAHEFRTPLTPASLHLHMLEQAKLTEAQSRSVAALRRSFTRLNFLVDDLVEASRLQGTMRDIRFRSVVVQDILDEVTDRYGHEAAQAHLSLEADAPPGEVLCERQPLTRALGALVSNAIRFSPAGGVVRIEVQEKGGFWRWAVQDQGPGVLEAQREGLFQPFAEGKDLAGSGFGLGLFIARSVIVRHGGRIWYEEAPGGGARFVFEVPDGHPAG